MARLRREHPPAAVPGRRCRACPCLRLLLVGTLCSPDALLAALHVAEPAPDASPLRFGSDGRPAGRSGAGQRAVCCVVFSVTRVSSFVTHSARH